MTPSLPVEGTMGIRGACVASGLAALLAAGLAAPAFAGDEDPEQAPAEAAETGEEDEEEEAESPLSGMFQSDITNAYFFRGILNERASLIWQPWFELYLSILQSDEGPIRDVTIGGGIWNSIHDEETLAEDDPEIWYEADLYPLISIEFPYAVTLTTTYYWYKSPNDAFDTVEELNFRIEWDDSETLGRWALAPWVNLAIETHNTSFGDDEGVGIQFGVEPTLYEWEHESYPVTITAPLEMGLAIENYYEEDNGEEDTFGYFSWGLGASVPLAFVPESLGDWSASLSAKGFVFSDALKRANDDDRLYPVVMQSLTVEF
jgi:hypothetical protein